MSSPTAPAPASADVIAQYAAHCDRTPITRRGPEFLALHKLCIDANPALATYLRSRLVLADVGEGALLLERHGRVCAVQGVGGHRGRA